MGRWMAAFLFVFRRGLLRRLGFAFAGSRGASLREWKYPALAASSIIGFVAGSSVRKTPIAGRRDKKVAAHALTSNDLLGIAVEIPSIFS